MKLFYMRVTQLKNIFELHDTPDARKIYFIKNIFVFIIQITKTTIISATMVIFRAV